MAENKKIVLALFILSAVLLFLSVFSFLNKSAILREYPVSFVVEKGTVGFDLNNSALTFGKIPPGGTGERKIDFYNNQNETIKIKILASRELENFLNFESDYEILSKKNVTIPVRVVVPFDAEEGNYSGKIRILLKR